MNLTSGWNLVSFFVKPTNPAINVVFAPIMSKIDIIKTDTKFYDKSIPSFLNTLSVLEDGKAYLIHMKSAGTITINGSEIGSISQTLKAGWNLCGYPKKTTQTIQTGLTSIYTNLTTIKCFDGFFEKNNPLNSIQNLEPGKGYFIKVSTNCILNQ